MKYSMSSDAIYCALCEFFDSQRDDAKDCTLEMKIKTIKSSIRHLFVFFVVYFMTMMK